MEEDKLKPLVNRASRIEGQLRGIKAMLENGSCCTDIVTQISAVTAALDSLNKQILLLHVQDCLGKGLKESSDEAVAELTDLLRKVIR